MLSIQGDAIVSDCKLRDETSALVQQLVSQLDLCIKENARVMSEKDKELNELKDAKSKVIDVFDYQLAKLRNNNARTISEKELNKRIDEKTNFIDRLN